MTALGRDGRRREALIVAVGVAALLSALLILLLPGGGRAAAQGGDTVILPVWAFADGDTPVSNARVRVYPSGKGGAAHHALQQASGAALDRTSSTGTALLEFASLPSRFTVVVSGGEARGRPLGGDFRAEVHGYQPSDVVDVTPLTTLIAADLAARHRAGHDATVAQATHGVERLLRIPRWVDAIDLERSDEAFDGDSFMKRAAHAGGADELVARLVRLELESGDQARPFREQGKRSHRSSAPIAGAANRTPTQILRGPAPPIFKEGFNWLLETALGKLGDYVLIPDFIQEKLIGWALNAVFGEEKQEDPLDEIRAALAALGEGLTQVKGNVASAKLDTLVALTKDTTGRIDHAQSQLSLLAKVPRSDPTRAKFGATVTAYIGEKLIDAPSILQQHLGADVPLASNVIKAASEARHKNQRFFDKSDSAAVRSVYDYYAAYQLALAVLLTNYWHSKPDTYSGQVIKAGIEAIKGNVDQQQGLLKPTVPDGTVIDTKTNKMWTQDFRPNPKADGSKVDAWPFAQVPEPPRGKKTKVIFPAETWGPRSIPGYRGPDGQLLRDWYIPAGHDIETLIDGRGNEKAPHYLDREARIRQTQTDAVNGYLYIAAWTFRPGEAGLFGADDRLEIRRFHIWGPNIDTREVSWPYRVVEGPNGAHQKLESFHGATMYQRGVKESYWW